MSDWNYLNCHRVTPEMDPMFGTAPEDGFNGFFCIIVNNLRIKCIASDGRGWRHVSVSIAGSCLPPSWNVMCKVKDLFWEPEDWVVQYHPAQSDYVNNHPGVLHLWQPTEVQLPKPDRLMVGVKDEADMAKVNADPHSPFKFKIGVSGING